MPDVKTCRVYIADDLEDGAFANGFRVVSDSDGESFLDFMLYSHINNKAVVVSRVRVDDQFLESIRSHLSEKISKKTVCLSV